MNPGVVEAAWDAVHEALPARWRVGPVTFHPGVLGPDGCMGAFSVTARGPHPGRGKVPVTVSGPAGTKRPRSGISTIDSAAFRSLTALGWTSCAVD